MFLFLQPVVVTIFRFLNNKKNSTNIHVHWTLDFNHKRSNWVAVQYIQYLKMCNTWTLNNLVAAAWIRVKNLNIWYTSWCSICYTKPSFFKRLNTVPIWVKQQDGEVLNLWICLTWCLQACLVFCLAACAQFSLLSGTSGRGPSWPPLAWPLPR